MSEPDMIIVSQKMNPKFREITFAVDSSIVVIVNENGVPGNVSGPTIPRPCPVLVSP